MANLIVRNLDNKVVNALKKRAAQHGKSAEAEHRTILEQALLRTNKKSFAEIISNMPNVGEDKDFERIEDEQVKERVFG